jgi:hypothetical protein
MQIKTTMRYPWVAMTMAKVQNTKQQQGMKRAWSIRDSHLLLVGMQNDNIISEKGLTIFPQT